MSVTFDDHWATDPIWAPLESNAPLHGRAYTLHSAAVQHCAYWRADRLPIPTFRRLPCWSKHVEKAVTQTVPLFRLDGEHFVLLVKGAPKYSDKRSEAGKKGAEIRWQNHSKPVAVPSSSTGGVDGAEPSELPQPLTSSSSGPSSSSETRSGRGPASMHERDSHHVGPDASAVREIFNHWLFVFEKDSEKTTLTADRHGKVLARLREGKSVEDIKRAIDGCKRSAFHVENGHIDLATICKSAAAVDSHIARLTRPVKLVDGMAPPSPFTAFREDSVEEVWGADDAGQVHG